MLILTAIAENKCCSMSPRPEAVKEPLRPSVTAVWEHDITASASPTHTHAENKTRNLGPRN